MERGGSKKIPVHSTYAAEYTHTRSGETSSTDAMAHFKVTFWY
jgi:hypothetical protein